LKLKQGSKLIKKYLSIWSYRLGLRWWTIDILMYDDPTSILDNFGNEDNHIVLARTWVEWKYAHAKILFNLPEFCKLSEDKIEAAVLHELCHVLINEMREGELHHEERVVTQLQKAFNWTAVDAAKSESEGLK
jgi:hypothetical protein